VRSVSKKRRLLFDLFDLIRGAAVNHIKYNDLVVK
jgi:hypothetical protein